VEEEKARARKDHRDGSGGRLTKADVLKAMENRGKAEPSEVVVAEAEEKSEPREARFIRKKMSPLRRKNRAAVGDGAAHRGDSHHVLTNADMSRGAGIAPEQAR